MTYCDFCKKEIRNDKWREHIISENHMDIKQRGYCKICKEEYHISPGSQYCSYETNRTLARENHNISQNHKENQELFDLYFS